MREDLVCAKGRSGETCPSLLKIAGPLVENTLGIIPNLIALANLLSTRRPDLRSETSLQKEFANAIKKETHPCMESFLPLTRKTARLCLSQMMVRSLDDIAVS